MDVTLVAETGRPTGSRPAGRLRAAGKVPGVLYGMGRDPLTISVDWPEFRRAITSDAGINALITLKVDGEEQLTIIKEMQRDPVKRQVLHVDFIAIDANVEITVDVPITLIGDAEEVTREGGLVSKVLDTLSVSAKPDAIPTEIEYDISALVVGGTVTAGEVVLPAGVTMLTDPEEAVASGQITRAALAEEDAGEGEEGEGEEGEEGEGGDAEASADGDSAGDDEG